MTGPHSTTHLINMRLSPEQISAIKHAAHTVLGPSARVVLFGSRADPAKRSGDIDLLFQTDQALANRATTIGQLYVALVRSLGDRKIDILLQDPNTPFAPVLHAAHRTGIPL